MVRLIAPVVAVRDFAAEILASLYIDFKYCFDLFAGGTAMLSLNKGNTAQSPPGGFALNLLAYFPSSCTEIP